MFSKKALEEIVVYTFLGIIAIILTHVIYSRTESPNLVFFLAGIFCGFISNCASEIGKKTQVQKRFLRLISLLLSPLFCFPVFVMINKLLQTVFDVTYAPLNGVAVLLGSAVFMCLTMSLLAIAGRRI